MSAGPIIVLHTRSTWHFLFQMKKSQPSQGVKQRQTFKKQSIGSSSKQKTWIPDPKPAVKIDSDAPIERSTKLPSTSKRIIFKPPPDSKARDPRFDPLSGEFNRGLFDTSYSFVTDLQKQEVKQIKSLLKGAKGAKQSEQQELKKSLTSLESQIKHKENLKQVGELKNKVRKEMPNYRLNPGKLRKLQLKQQFDSMSKSAVLKLMEKKRIKNTRKEKRNFFPRASSTQ